MAKIAIYDKSGAYKVNSHGDRVYGKMKYVGQTMSISYLEFTIASPYPIAWNVGDYVDWGAGLIGATNLRFMLFSIPQPKKEAEGGLYGGGFVYSGAQFHDLGQILSWVLFTDMEVEADNLIHYSTRSGLSTYENVAGILVRFQSCMDAYRLGLSGNDPMRKVKFYFQLCTSDSIAFQRTIIPDNTLGGEDEAAYEALIAEARSVTIDGSVLDGLNNLQSVWPAVGWDVKTVKCVYTYLYDTYNRIARAEEITTGIIFAYTYSSSSALMPNSIKDPYGQECAELPKQIVFVTVGAVNFVSNAGATPQFVRKSGLINLRKYVSNQSDFLTVLVPYGSERNLPGRYYNGKEIINAESVDIPNLMIPLSAWGKTSGVAHSGEAKRNLPDARKAYIIDADIISKYGAIPKIVRFDNSENGDIYPTIKGIIVQDVLDYYDDGGAVDYPPDDTYWSADQPLDKVLGVQPDISDDTVTAFDGGFAGDDGRGALFKATNSDGGTGTRVLTNPTSGSTGQTSLNVSKTFTIGSAIPDAEIYPIIKNAVLKVAQTGGLTFNSAYAFIMIQWYENGHLRLTTRASQADNVLVVSNDALSMSLTKDVISLFNNGVIDASRVDAGQIQMILGVTLNYTVVTGGSNITITFDVAGDYVLTVNAPLLTNFRLRLPPFGYDLTDMVVTEGEVKIAMTSGACAGREFVVTACSFDAHNGMTLSLNRVYDDSLGQYFPNADSPVAVDDSFVILGIAMPEFYILAASERLLTKAQTYYAQHSKLKYLYDLEIDSKWMRGQTGAYLRPGMYMKIVDSDLIGASAVYVLIDTVTITENEKNIPTFKVTLREKLYLPE